MISKISSVLLLKNNCKFLISINQRYFAQQPREKQKGYVKGDTPKTDLDPRDILSKKRNDQNATKEDNKSSWADMNKDYNQSFNPNSGTSQGFGVERTPDARPREKSQGYEKKFENRDENMGLNRELQEQGTSENVKSVGKVTLEKTQTKEAISKVGLSQKPDNFTIIGDEFGENKRLKKLREQYKEEFDAIYKATGRRAVDSHRLDFLWKDIIALYEQESIFDQNKPIPYKGSQVDVGQSYAKAVRESLDTRANWLYATMWQMLRSLGVDPDSWRNTEYHARFDQKCDDYSHRLQLRMAKSSYIDEDPLKKPKLTPIEEATQYYKEKLSQLVASSKELGLVDQIPQMKKHLLKDIKKRYNLESNDINKIIEAAAI